MVGSGGNVATGVAMSGDATLINDGTLTIAANAIDSGKLADGAVLSTHIADNSIIDADISSTANIDATKLATGVVDNTEFNYLDGVTSAIQTQLSNKATLGGDDGAVILGSNDSTLALEANGGVAMTIDGTRRLGIGGTPATTARLKVFGTAVGGGTPIAEFADSSGNVRISILDEGSTSSGAAIRNTGAYGLALVNQHNSGAIRFFTNSPLQESMRITAAGRVGIGTTNPATDLDVVGDIQYSGTLTDVSDRRFKDEILPLENSLDKVLELQGVSFVMKDDESRRKEIGVIAQEVEKVMPELVHTSDDEMQKKSVNYIGFIGYLIESIKELANYSFEKFDTHDREMASINNKSLQIELKLSKLKEENARLKVSDSSKALEIDLLKTANAKLIAADALKNKKIEALERRHAELSTRLDEIEKMLKSK